MPIVSETGLTKMVSDYGQLVMSTMTDSVYASPLVNACVIVAAGFAILKVAQALRAGEPSKDAGWFFFMWLLCIPYRGMPSGFVIVDSISKAVASVLDKATTRALDLARSDGSGSKMPPGYIANGIIRSSAMKISDPNVRKNTLTIMDNCVPSQGQGVLNNDGDPISAVDLFAPVQTPGARLSGVFKYNYPSSVETLLRDRKHSGIVDTSGRELDCLDALNTTRQEYYRDVVKQLRDEKIIAPNDSMPPFTYDGDAPYLGASWSSLKYAVPATLDAAKAQAVFVNQAVGSSLLDISGANIVKRAYNGIATDAVRPMGQYVVDDLAAGNFGGAITGAAYAWNNLSDIVARGLNIDHTLENAKALKELDDKFRMLPYFIASAQLILKILAPLAFLALLFGGERVCLTWSSMWFASYLYPIVAQFSRSITNGFLHSIYVARSNAYKRVDPAFLPQGVDLYAVNDMMDETRKLLNSMLNMEITIWGVMATMMLGGAWFAGGRTSSMLQSAIKMGGRHAMRKLMRSSSGDKPNAGESTPSSNGGNSGGNGGGANNSSGNGGTTSGSGVSLAKAPTQGASNLSFVGESAAGSVTAGAAEGAAAGAAEGAAAGTAVCPVVGTIAGAAIGTAAAAGSAAISHAKNELNSSGSGGITENTNFAKAQTTEVG